MSFDNLSQNDYLQILYLSLFLLLMLSRMVFKRHIQASTLLKQSLAWLAIVLFTIIAYSYRYNFYPLKDRVMRELLPSKAVTLNDHQIAIVTASDGHFYMDVAVNGQKIKFMIDTGASDITLSLNDAKRVGIDIDHLTLSKQYQTANGVISNLITTVPELAIGDLVFKNMGVAVNGSPMGASLLGMSFLSRFKKYEFYQDRLILTY